METTSRADQLAEVRRDLGKKFPKAKFFTNDDANPATPFIVRAEWGNGKVIKTVRADSPRSTVQEFLSKAVAVLEPFQADNVPTRHLT
jgi:hypothetical protein